MTNWSNTPSTATIDAVQRIIKDERDAIAEDLATLVASLPTDARANAQLSKSVKLALAQRSADVLGELRGVQDRLYRDYELVFEIVLRGLVAHHTGAVKLSDAEYRDLRSACDKRISAVGAKLEILALSYVHALEEHGRPVPTFFTGEKAPPRFTGAPVVALRAIGAARDVSGPEMDDSFELAANRMYKQADDLIPPITACQWLWPRLRGYKTRGLIFPPAEAYCEPNVRAAQRQLTTEAAGPDGLLKAELSVAALLPARAA